MTYTGSKTANAGGEQRKIAYCPPYCVPTWDAFLIFWAEKEELYAR